MSGSEPRQTTIPLRSGDLRTRQSVVPDCDPHTKPHTHTGHTNTSPYPHTYDKDAQVPSHDHKHTPEGHTRSDPYRRNSRKQTHTTTRHTRQTHRHPTHTHITRNPCDRDSVPPVLPPGPSPHPDPQIARLDHRDPTSDVERVGQRGSYSCRPTFPVSVSDKVN